jgi:hypothetical protein
MNVFFVELKPDGPTGKATVEASLQGNPDSLAAIVADDFYDGEEEGEGAGGEAAHGEDER